MKKPPLYAIFIIAIALAALTLMLVLANTPGSEPVLQDSHDPQQEEMQQAHADTSPPPGSQQGLLQNLQEGSDIVTQPEVSLITYQEHDGQLELPVNGATGWAARNLPLRTEPRTDAEVTLNLAPGQGFVILEEQGEWWNVQLSGDVVGWVEHGGCFINLPDIIPSIVYRISNAEASLKRSSGVEIPNITGQVLYDAWAFNHRLGRYEFVAPALYAMCGKIALIQSLALENGDTIIMYEAFRPRETQQKVVSNLRYLIYTDEEVNRAINTPPWSMGAFIATSLSDHQRGVAIDVSLGKIISQEIRATGGYAYTHITEYEEYETPSPMHELSPQSAAYRITASSGAARLRSYCVDEVGLRPVSSEWWHFSDPASGQIASRHGINGAFYVYSIHSVEPYAIFEDDSLIIFSDGMPLVEDPPPLPDLPTDEQLTEDEDELLIEALIDALIAEMSLFEQISQLFVLIYEAEISELPDEAEVLELPDEMETTEPSDEIAEFARIYGAGGYILRSENIDGIEIMDVLMEALGELSPILPFVFTVGDGELERLPPVMLNSENGEFDMLLPFMFTTGDGEFSRLLPFMFIIGDSELSRLLPVLIIIYENDRLELLPPLMFIVEDGDFSHELDGLIISDDMDMDDIAENYTAAEAAVMAVQAGVCMILLPEDFDDALDGVLQVIEDGTIQHEHVLESLRRILKAKLMAGLIIIEE